MSRVFQLTVNSEQLTVNNEFLIGVTIKNIEI